MLLDKHHSKYLLGYWATSDRVLLVNLNGKPIYMSLFQTYALTSDTSEEDMERFYELLDAAKQQYKSQEIFLVMGDFSTKVGET